MGKPFSSAPSATPDWAIVSDNVIFETGLFIGSRGRNNTLVVINRTDVPNLKLPSDFVGAISEQFNLGEPVTGKTTESEFLRLAAMIADRWHAQQFVLESGTSKVLRKREECYRAGVQMVQSAFCRVATVLSYPGEVTSPASPDGNTRSSPLWEQVGTIENELYDAICRKARERGVKVYRWMNLGVDAIREQAVALIEMLENHKLKEELFIKDTYCEFIECIVADDYVLLVLPNEKERDPTDIEVGVGLLIRNRTVANYFFDWFEKRLPVIGQLSFSEKSELDAYCKTRSAPPWAYVPPVAPLGCAPKQ